MAIPSRPARRAALLRALKARKVAGGAHAFIRAHAALFYAEVERLGPDAIPAGPEIWICGDCHTENVGAVCGEGLAATIEINDFDEAVIGQPALDVLRMALALTALGRAAGQGGHDVGILVAALLGGYGEGLASDPEVAPAPPRRFRKLLRRAGAQSHRGLLDRRAPRADGSRRFLHGDRYWPLAHDERWALRNLLDDARVEGLVATLSPAASGDASLRDAAFRVAGTGSLGCFRAALLVHDGGDEGDEAVHLLDVKQALPASAPRAPRTPVDDARRIVEGARALAPAVGARMRALSVEGTMHHAVVERGGRSPVVVRELQPQELKGSLGDLTLEEAPEVGRFLGATVGRAHRRQLSPRDARAWRRAACEPGWLRRALPALVGGHERAYLSSCLEVRTCA